MGCAAEIIVFGGSQRVGGASGLTERALHLLAELETRWSRFVPSSDITTVNANPGVSVSVHWTTRNVVLLAIEAWSRTDGRYDPTILPALSAHGYDRNFRDIDANENRLWDGSVKRPVPSPAPGCAGITVDVVGSAIRLPRGVALDLGGIGKGYAADLVASDLVENGATGALVNIGGDVRVCGAPPEDTWVIRIEDPHDARRTIDLLRIVDGAVAVSCTRSRRWSGPLGDSHHIVDPATGRPTTSGLCCVAVLAGAGWWAEVLTKAMLVAGATDAFAVLDHIGEGAHALTVREDGYVASSEGLRPFSHRGQLRSTC